VVTVVKSEEQPGGSSTSPLDCFGADDFNLVNHEGITGMICSNKILGALPSLWETKLILFVS
jgi:hypothetical protein